MRRRDHNRLPLVIIAAFIIALCSTCSSRTKPARVVVRTEPEIGAEVYVWEELKGTTPLELDGLEPGMYSFVLKKEGYDPAFKVVTLEPGDNPELVVRMELIVGRLIVSCVPREAKVFINGRLAAEGTPFETTLPVGTYEVRLEHEDYEPLVKTVELRRTFPEEINVKLKPLPARITIDSKPKGAKIYINELRKSRRTPATLELPPNEYRIAVELSGFAREEQSVVLKPNDNVKVTFDLQVGDVPYGMVKVSEGEFIMGSDRGADDEKPVHKVFLPTYFIDKFEVTNEAYARVFPGHTYPDGEDRFPVTGVSWYDAVAYAEAVGKRLPTEAEWEKAARGLTGNIYPWGDEFNPEYANVRESFILKPVAVGSFLKGCSPFGCYDMAGNVWEWVNDFYQPYPGNTVHSTDYGTNFRVLRGGAYDMDAYYARCANRHYAPPGEAAPSYGFRCALSPHREEKR